MKIAFIADTHFGARKNSKFIMEMQKRYFKEYFFPYLYNNDIKIVVHFGDFFDSRKTINFNTLRHSVDSFIKPLIDNGIHLHMLVGNHDSYYKSSGELVSTKILFSSYLNVTIYDTPTVVELDGSGCTFLMVPWIFPNKKEETIKMIKTSTADYCCGHFEMLGVEMQRNRVSKKGVDTGIFSHFNHVFSGHFHKKSTYYIGSPYQMSWADYDDEKRIIVLDTDTGIHEDVYLAETTFHEIIYPLRAPLYMETYRDKMVRVRVLNMDNPAEFDKFIAELEAVEPFDIDIKNEYLYMDVINEDVKDDMDTLSVLLDSVKNINELSEGDAIVVCEILRKLYEKAKGE